jgi:hypothetical protein
MAEKVRILRTMTDGDELDETLAAYLDAAAELILNIVYPMETERDGLTVPDRYVMNQLNIAAYWINKRGAEGEIQHIENGIHRNYGSSDVPEAMIRHITPFCGVVK